MQRVPYFHEPNACRKLVVWVASLVLAALLASGCASSSPAGRAIDAPANSTAESATEPATGPPAEPALNVTQAAAPLDEDAQEPTIQSREDRLDLMTPKAIPDVVYPEDVNPVTGEAPQEIVDAIMADLSASAGVLLDSIQITRAESVVWPDGSLGCAKPDEMYTQAPVNGYWMVLEAAGERYDYRANSNGFFFACEGSRRAPSVLATPAM